MKKLILILSVLLSFSSGLFAFDFFEDRFFEVQYGADVSISNNSILIGDVLKKDLVIDLRKLADNVPDSGFNLSANLLPFVHAKFGFGVFSLAFNGGVQAYTSLTIGDDIFDFLGYGNSVGQTISTDVAANVDVFAFLDVDVGIKFKKFHINVAPAMFVPVLSTSGSAGNVTVVNDSSGNITMRYDMNVNVYSPFNIQTRQIETQELLKSAGYDVAAELCIPFGNKLNVTANARIPILPGKAKYLTNATSSFLFQGNLSNQTFSNSNTEMQYSTSEVSAYTVHRPLKVGVYLDYLPLGRFLDLGLGGGMGISRPFSDSAKFYPEYFLGLTMNVIRVFTFKLTTEYTDQVFIHQFGMDINLRFIELDAGISAQSPDFLKSFTGAGFGGYVYVTLGF
ncbi:MAG: hypothetical protein K6C97_08825 [Treponema sp.]|nr:hypothetical protein [Treponema sp.]